MSSAFAAAPAVSPVLAEVEHLRSSLPLRDPSRPALTLRLADLSFDEAGSLARTPEPSEELTNQIIRLRRRALKLYEEALSGNNGTFPAVVGNQKLKIQFQMARLDSDLGEPNAALPIWKQLVQNEDIPMIRREAALRLAEHAESLNSRAGAKEAEGFYRTAMSLCAGGDSCSYIHYRTGWTLYQQDRLPEAIAEMKLSLTDSRGKLNEEGLRDLLMFYSKQTTDLDAALVSVEAIGQKWNRPNLMVELADGYFAAGNRSAGVKALETADGKNPSLKNEVRLLEEDYGFRDWDKFRSLLTEVTEKASAPGVAIDPADRKMMDTVLKRLAVQLDGERKTSPQTTGDFQNVTLAWLTLFTPDAATNPAQAKMVSQMRDGWLVSEANPQKKMAQLKSWESVETRPTEIVRLREMRASAAQKAGAQDVVVEEMAALSAAPATSAADASKQREYRYLRARALYEKKDYGTALPEFQALAQPTAKPLGEEKFSIESQNLALDILGIQKRYADVQTQAAVWTNAKSVSPKVASEVKDMAKVGQSSRFEQAVVGGKTDSSLKTFAEYCLADKEAAKSCENARVLALQLKDQATLIQILRKEGKTQELASELEAAGEFAEAAQILEKESRTGKRPASSVAGVGGPLMGPLKIALLYELGGKTADRDRVLRECMAKATSPSQVGASEPLLYASLKDAGLLTPAALKLGWTPTVKLQLARSLEEQGRGSAETHKMLLGSKEAMGPAWTQLVMQEISTADQAQSKIGFYGRNGKAMFGRRVAGLRKLDQVAEVYLPGSDAATRVRIAARLRDAHVKLVEQIMGSPIPDSVKDEALTQVKASLAELAKPFQDKAQAYQTMAQEQWSKIPETGDEAAERRSLQALVQVTPGSATPEVPIHLTQAAPVAVAAPASEEVRAQSLAQLHANPQDTVALSSLKTWYESHGSARLASYFEGRLQALQKEGKSS